MLAGDLLARYEGAYLVTKLAPSQWPGGGVYGGAWQPTAGAGVKVVALQQSSSSLLSRAVTTPGRVARLLNASAAEVLVQRLDALKQGKAEAEAHEAEVSQPLKEKVGLTPKSTLTYGASLYNGIPFCLQLTTNPGSWRVARDNPNHKWVRNSAWSLLYLVLGLDHVNTRF